jgi:VanZ family protein
MYGALMIMLTFSFGFNPGIPGAAFPSFLSLFFPGVIASVVGILDEINQAYIPQRTASITDVLLDMTGIVLTGILVYSFQQRKRRKWTTTSKMKLI